MKWQQILKAYCKQTGVKADHKQTGVKADHKQTGVKANHIKQVLFHLGF